MNADTINLIIKVGTLFFLAATTQLAMHRRHWSLSIITTGIWLGVFRLTIVRAMVVYIGVFQKEPPQFIAKSIETLRSGAIANITDVMLLLAVLVVFIYLAAEGKNGR